MDTFEAIMGSAAVACFAAAIGLLAVILKRAIQNRLTTKEVTE